MWHVCKALSLNILEEATYGHSMNTLFVHTIELGHDLLAREADGRLEYGNLLVSGECHMGLTASAVGGGTTRRTWPLIALVRWKGKGKE